MNVIHPTYLIGRGKKRMYVRKDTEPLADRAHLAIATVHGDEMTYIQEALDTNWVTTAGSNITALEELAARTVGVRSAVGLGTGTSALHMCVKLAAEKAYGPGLPGQPCLAGKRVFATDMTFAATVNPAVYEGAELVFIDSERDTWNMDPDALTKAFALYPDTRIVIVANLYGTPARLDRIREVCTAHDAILIEDAAESLGATYLGRQTGTFGDLSAISFNGNKIITGSCGGMLLTDDTEAAAHARKWSTQSREPAAWYQHEEIGYNYRMSNITAGIVRAQFPHLSEHIAQKKAVYMRYKEGLAGLPVTMNPYLADCSEPNFWLSCLLIDEDAMCECTRTATTSSFTPTHGKTCPDEILAALASINAEGRPIWKPMSMQPVFAGNAFVTTSPDSPVDADIFRRGLCLPSDNKLTQEAQMTIIETIKRCFE